jgi:Ca2+-binding RTX toxin-like protein
VASWINYFYGNKTVIYGSNGNDDIVGTDQGDHILAYSGNDTVDAGAGDDLVEGSWGADVLNGGTGNDILYGDADNDTVNGGDGSDRYIISGNEAGGWSSFQGYDTYNDNGTNGTDTIVAVGSGAVDIGLLNFGSANGIEAIDGEECFC